MEWGEGKILQEIISLETIVPIGIGVLVGRGLCITLIRSTLSSQLVHIVSFVSYVKIS